MNPWTVPNFLTLVRFAIGFWLVATAVIQPSELQALQWWAFGMVCVAFATDWLDGKIARMFPSQQSRLGEYIDPPADKLAVTAYMFYLLMLGTAGTYFEYICFSVIVAREVGVLIWRWLGGSDLLPVNDWGKRKTAAQMGALLLYGLLPLWSELYWPAFLVLLVATGLTVWSLIVYLLQGKLRVV